MITLYKLGLAPLLLTQAKHLRRTALRLPEPAGAREGCADAGSGQRIRILFLGDSSAAGVGVGCQEQALALQASALLAQRSGMRVDWQLVAKSGINAAGALELLDTETLKPADIVVTALGVNDVTSQFCIKRFVGNYKAVMDKAFRLTGAKTAVITGLPPMHVLPAIPQPLRWYLGQCAHRLDKGLRRWTAEHTHLEYLSMQWAAQPEEMARDGYHPGPNLYRRWAELVAERCLLRLSALRGVPQE
ncbi:MAG: GDSL-like Lipase/Acylhydrolase family protein [Paucimonas sp.]|jgi:lysophospholipase L1-like esterase|nr:GDSL-like Lipase/Acylhydrolase family protein [Paucimonas sp.]